MNITTTTTLTQHNDNDNEYNNNNNNNNNNTHPTQPHDLRNAPQKTMKTAVVPFSVM